MPRPAAARRSRFAEPFGHEPGERVERGLLVRAARARIVMLLPHSAASIITPMMLFPLTARPSFTSSMCDWKLDASLTSRAAGRACIPSGLTIVAWRSITARTSSREERPARTPARPAARSSGPRPIDQRERRPGGDHGATARPRLAADRAAARPPTSGTASPATQPGTAPRSAPPPGEATRRRWPCPPASRLAAPSERPARDQERGPRCSRPRADRQPDHSGAQRDAHQRQRHQRSAPPRPRRAGRPAHRAGCRAPCAAAGSARPGRPRTRRAPTRRAPARPGTGWQLKNSASAPSPRGGAPARRIRRSLAAAAPPRTPSRRPIIRS